MSNREMSNSLKFTVVIAMALLFVWSVLVIISAIGAAGQTGVREVYLLAIFPAVSAVGSAFALWCILRKDS